MHRIKFRHEDKYICSLAQINILKARIQGLLRPDAHVDQSGQYNVRSVYFDDVNSSCYYENKNGVDPREKYRIRIYNHDSNRGIALELKRKQQGLTYKQSCKITKEQCNILLSNKTPPIDDDSPPLLRKLCLLMHTRLFRPVIIVEYNRTPFVCKAGNVRITFDHEIKASNAVSSFLEESIPGRPIMPLGQNILEIKWDEFLPGYIKRTLQTDYLSKTTYSKYFTCRRFNLNGRDINELF